MSRTREPHTLSESLSAIALELSRACGYENGKEVERVIRAVARGQQKKEKALLNALIETIDALEVNDRRALVIEINRRYGKE